MSRESIKVKATQQTPSTKAAPFKPGEFVILAHYLAKQRSLPSDLSRTPLPAPVKEAGWNERKNGVTLHFDINGEADLALENAVARICLAAVQNQLPQWAAGDSAGKMVFGRKVKPARRLSGDGPRPEFLFEINWADSGPGMSWPEAYWVTHLPCFHCSIVTASNDSPDAIGYCDYAIGWFQDRENLLEQVRRIVLQYWRHQAEETGLDEWAEFLRAGLVDKETANNWGKALKTTRANKS